MRRLALLILACLLGSALAPAASAATRRALLVGINAYARGADEDTRWTDLRGAVNDVEAMRAILVARFGFEASDVVVLTDGAATREAILSGLRGHLVERSEGGDVAVFYFAGHGSQLHNPESTERDGLDETIVPADSNRGAPDIRDKELRALFNDVLDRGARMIAVFDSCNSGSITRGDGAGLSRYLPPATGARAELTPLPADPRPPPEQRGALIFSAAGDDQEARETLDDAGQPRGAFSHALHQALRATPGDETAERIYRRTAALLAANQAGQVPVLAAAGESRRRPLLVEGDARAPATPVAAVVSVDGDRVVLDGGMAAGLNAGAELVGATPQTKGLRLRVEATSGVSRASAVRVRGDAAALRRGALFRLERWAAPGQGALRIAVGAAPARDEDFAAAVALLSELRPLPELGWVEDPSEATPSHVLSYAGGAWQLRGPDGRSRRLGPALSAVALRSAVAAVPGSPTRLFAALPPSPSLARELRARARESAGLRVGEEGAHYRLVGRVDAGGPAYAWVANGVDRDDPALPDRSDWQPLPGGPTGALDSSAALEEDALRIAAVRAWLTLEAPPDAGSFPYHLALREPASGRLVMGGTVFDGEEFELVLERAGDAAAAERRYVYVFVIDGNGRRSLLFPAAAAGNVENQLPPARGGQVLAPAVIPLGDLRLRIAPPFGTDTLVLVSSRTPLADPTVLEGAAIRTREVRAPGGGLDALLAGVGRFFEASPGPTASAWGLDRLTIQTRP